MIRSGRVRGPIACGGGLAALNGGSCERHCDPKRLANILIFLMNTAVAEAV